MNLGNEVIVKNFHVLSGAHIVTKVEKDGKVYFKITKSDGTTPDVENQQVTTDQFCLESIKRIRLTKPEGAKFHKWEITAPTLATGSSASDYADKNGVLYTVYMHFENLFGYGITDRWEKFATIKAKVTRPATVNTSNVTSANNTAKAAFVTDLAARINAQYINGNKPIIATADTTNYKVVITDNTFAMQTPTRRRMEIGADPQPVQMYLTTNIIDGEDTSWASEVRTAAEHTNANGILMPMKYAGVVDTSKTYKNDYLIWGLEKVSQLNSTESMADPCTGFIGYDSVMDNAQLNTNNYWVLDIAYETLPKMGVPSGRNLKELSFAAVAGTSDAVPTVLTNLLAGLGYELDSNGEVVPITPEDTSSNG